MEFVELEGVVGAAAGVAAGALDVLSLDLESDFESDLDSEAEESFFVSIWESAAGAELLLA